MASLSCNDTVVCINCGLNTYILRLCGSELFCIEHPKNTLCKTGIGIPDKSDSKVTPLNSDDDVGLGLLCSDISPCGNLLAFCSTSKSLCIVDISKSIPCLQNVHRLARGASKLIFTPKSKYIVVADKSGDVFLYSHENADSVGKLILGHLSMLLDVLVTPDENFIITCDRDEKIRVSSFPNGYNIIAYCLGHTEFVSSILLLPHNHEILASASGDGTVRFWDFKSGTELEVCDTFKYLASNDNNRYSNQGDEDVTAITDATSLILDKVTSLICVCLDHVKICLVLKCVTDDKGLVCTICQNVSFNELSPWKATISSNVLWFLVNSDDKIFTKAMIFNKKSGLFEDKIPDQIVKALDMFNGKSMDMKKNIVNLLFKRKFDNVHEYLKKKDERLTLTEPSIKKSKQYTEVSFYP